MTNTPARIEKRAQQATEGAQAWAEYLAEPEKVRERTARLREARLARDADAAVTRESKGQKTRK
jgi:hypothetical protein